MSAFASLMSPRIPKGGVVASILVLALLVPLLQNYAPEVLPRLHWMNNWARVAIVALLLAPIALVSGITFPWLVSPFRKVNGNLVSLLYAWNLGFTVIGSAFALVWASEHGFRAAGLNLVLGYCGLAGVVLWIKAHERTSGENKTAETEPVGV
jgi:hypothetical protein